MTTTAPCAHHWILSTPAGPLASAWCKKCGAERMFRNALENDITWSDLSARGHDRRRAS